MEYMQICALVTRIMGLKQVKAMREASGDQRGVSAMERREVSGVLIGAVVIHEPRVLWCRCGS